MQNNLRLAEYCEPLYCKVGRRWAFIKGFDKKYQISDDGIIRSIGRYTNIKSIYGKILMAHTCKLSGHKRVALYREGIKRRFQVSRLVGLHFLAKPAGDYMIKHIDGNNTNNHYRNLQWVTKQEIMDSIDRKGINNGNHRFNNITVLEITNGCNRGIPVKKLAEENKVTRRTIYNILRKKSWKHVN